MCSRFGDGAAGLQPVLVLREAVCSRVLCDCVNIRFLVRGIAARRFLGDGGMNRLVRWLLVRWLLVGLRVGELLGNTPVGNGCWVVFGCLRRYIGGVGGRGRCFRHAGVTPSFQRFGRGSRMPVCVCSCVRVSYLLAAAERFGFLLMAGFRIGLCVVVV